MLTDDTLRKVRETARIDEVASGYLTLHRSGKDFVALCHQTLRWYQGRRKSLP